MNIKFDNLTIILISIIFTIITILLYNNIIKNQNTKYLTTNKKDTFNNTQSRYNEITYGMNPECLKTKSNSKFCPNAHPNIPCSLVENCNGSVNPNLTDEMKRDIYMYVYLTGLLETSDIFNADKDHYWYNYTINNPTTTTPVST